MPNYELTDAGLVTDEATIKTMYWKYSVSLLVGGEFDGPCFQRSVAYLDKSIIRIPWPTVWQSIQPVEGEGYVCVDNCPDYNGALIIQSDYQRPPVGFGYEYYHKRVLLIIDTRGELRELVSKCEEANNA